VGYLIFWDSLIYFLLTTITNLILFFLQYLGRDWNNIKRSSLPFSMLITTTMGCRLFLNLKLFNKRKESANIAPLLSHAPTQYISNSTELLSASVAACSNEYVTQWHAIACPYIPQSASMTNHTEFVIKCWLAGWGEITGVVCELSGPSVTSHNYIYHVRSISYTINNVWQPTSTQYYYVLV